MADIAFTPPTTAAGDSTVDNPLLYQVLKSSNIENLQQVVGYEGSLEYDTQTAAIRTLLAIQWLEPVLFFFFLLGILKHYKCSVPLKSQVFLFCIPFLNGAAFHGIFLSCLQAGFFQIFPQYQSLLLFMFKLNLVLWPSATLLFFGVWKENQHFAFIMYLLAAASMPFLDNLYPLSFQLSESLYPISLIYLQARVEVQKRKEER